MYQGPIKLKFLKKSLPWLEEQLRKEEVLTWQAGCKKDCNLSAPPRLSWNVQQSSSSRCAETSVPVMGQVRQSLR